MGRPQQARRRATTHSKLATRPLATRGLALIAVAAIGSCAFAATLDPSDIEVVRLAGADRSAVLLRAMILSGSAEDPEAKEGLASFTAHLMRRGPASLPRERFEERLRALKATLEVSVTKDAIVFRGAVPAESLEAYYPLFRDVLLAPALENAEMETLRAEQKAALDAIRGDPPALAREMLDEVLFRNHPYGHPETGRVAAIDAFTRSDVEAFRSAHLRKGNIVLGVAGADEAFAARLRKDFAVLPDGAPERPARSFTYLPRRRFLVIQGDARERITVAIGHPLQVTRAHADWFPMKIAGADLGEAGDAAGRLSQEIAMRRGLASDAFASIEPSAPPASLVPGIPRRLPSFTVQLDTAAANAKMAIKLAVAEVQDLAAGGLPPERLEAARARVLDRRLRETQSADGALAAAMDAWLDGTTGFSARYSSSAREVNAASVSLAVKKHLLPDRLGIVAFVRDAAAFIEEMLSPETKIASPPGIDREATRERDLSVVGSELGLKREDFEVVRAADLFR